MCSPSLGLASNVPFASLRISNVPLTSFPCPPHHISATGHEYIAADRRGQDCFKLFRLAVPRVLAVFSMFNSALVLLCLATVYNDSVASLVLAAAAADAALVLDRVGVVPQVLRATRELSFMTRILLQSSLAAWGVLISMNGVICMCVHHFIVLVFDKLISRHTALRYYCCRCPSRALPLILRRMSF